MLYITETQYKAYRENIAGRWEVYQGLPFEGFEIVPDDDTRADTIGAWVGTESNPQCMYIGIEPDGYTHS